MAQKKIEDQAASLRNRVEGKNSTVVSKTATYPTRRETHQNKKTKTKWKVSFPLIRLLLIFFIALILMLFTLMFWGDEYLFSLELSAVVEAFDHLRMTVSVSTNISIF